MNHNQRFIGQLIQIAPTVLAYAGEVQLIMGLYEVVSKAISGDRSAIYQAIITLIRNRLSADQTNQIINIMQTTITAIEYADALKGFLEEIIKIYNQQSQDVKRQHKASIDEESSYDRDLREILAIADRIFNEANK